MVKSDIVLASRNQIESVKLNELNKKLSNSFMSESADMIERKRVNGEINQFIKEEAVFDKEPMFDFT